MWWVEVILAVVAIILAWFIWSSADDKDEGFSSTMLLIAVLIIAIIDGTVRQSQSDCGDINNRLTGLYSGIPYETVGDVTKDGAKMFALVRIIDGTSTSHVRCVEIKEALPKKFVRISNNSVVSLLPSDTVPQAAK